MPDSDAEPDTRIESRLCILQYEPNAKSNVNFLVRFFVRFSRKNCSTLEKSGFIVADPDLRLPVFTVRIVAEFIRRFSAFDFRVQPQAFFPDRQNPLHDVRIPLQHGFGRINDLLRDLFQHSPVCLQSSDLIYPFSHSFFSNLYSSRVFIFPSCHS